MQLSTQLLIRKLPFARLTKEVVKTIQYPLRIASKALEALQTAVESRIVDIFNDAGEFTTHAKRKTLQKRDMELALRLRGRR